MTPAARLAAVQAAFSWLGTPYHHHARIKGAGVDCANLLCGVFAEAGVVGDIDLGHYPHDWHLHRNEERFLGWLAKFGRPLEPGERIQAADVAVFRFGRTFSHGAVMVDEAACIHAYIGRGAILSRLDEEPLHGRASQFWSIRP